ncbi:hypothetical protein [Pseudomonas sp. NPDC007930]|uniref:hypothetical protein n=1 Tax=Pseudomonas sp. NPDC007930 TaxID=3364417 RepID=UPI0036F0EB89
MAEPRIGYYVHHHGAGHGVRALAIAAAAPVPVTLLGSRLPNGPWPAHVDGLQLPPDYHPGVQAEAFDVLHYAPLAVPGLRQRMAQLAQWFAQHWPCLLVADVSVEVALLARLCSVPAVYVRQHGLRHDAAHRLAYASASGLLAPYPEAMAPAGDPWRGKTAYTGWVSRYNGLPVGQAEPGRVLVICGHGGTGLNAALLEAAAQACPQWRFEVAGALAPGRAAGNLRWLGELAAPAAAMQRAEVVIGSASDSLVSEAAALGCRYIAVAEQRPFAEQRLQARQLQALGVALGLEAGWPPAERWPALLAQARQLPPPHWQQWADAQAATRAAAALVGWLPRQ